MIPSVWRAWTLPLSRGVFALDTNGSGSWTRQYVSYEADGVARRINTPGELADALAADGETADRLARAHSFGLVYLLGVLTGRRYLLIRQTMWAAVEALCGLRPADCEARVEGGRLTMVVYTDYKPLFRVCRLTIDLATLDVHEEELVNAPWPPARVTAG